MNIQKVTFKNNDGLDLKGRLELPTHQKPHNFVLFAHCFTCNKNLSAVRNISRALTAKGFGVLRFDFTGLGESSGDFENTNFSGNILDLIEASKYLEENYAAPTLLIGHSLGGAAAIFAADAIDSIKAVATIAAPSNPDHVQHLLKSNLEEINTTGKAVVNLGGRDFTIKKQFLDDIKSKSLSEIAKNLNKALLILHSPQDRIVGIKNAEDLYIAAKHPKSFVSLDGSDHLLMQKEDSIYVGELIASWAKRYIPIPENDILKTTHDVVASLAKEEGFTTQLRSGNHNLIADEPLSFGGNDFGPSPYDYVSAGLSACTAMTVQMYAKRKQWDLDNIEVHTSYSKTHAEDCANCEENSAKIDTFKRTIKLTGHLDDKQIKRLLQIADKCPVHKTLHSVAQIITTLV
ncbi:bifunctional alpha/beta hydrolase/OsmC family protein [Bizionia paragorgiae]|uniref:Putative redox protein n=1 Tax=Bizionia paragorgiae TaxID=283786 RepID=A0A1H3Y5A4_BIZPA|nr:bifunctional alpha/beta hydrolase/OsmC family protein [Bizionia paragorgiae]SEA06710.1 putative redox protein [Bizionia paragorgiae]